MNQRLWWVLVFGFTLRTGASVPEVGFFTEPWGIESETGRELALELGAATGACWERCDNAWLQEVVVRRKFRERRILISPLTQARAPMRISLAEGLR